MRLLAAGGFRAWGRTTRLHFPTKKTLESRSFNQARVEEIHLYKKRHSVHVLCFSLFFLFVIAGLYDKPWKAASLGLQALAVFAALYSRWIFDFDLGVFRGYPERLRK